MGTIQGVLSIVVMSGSGMVNAAQTIQLLLNLFRVRGVVFYGRGAGADPNTLNIGDVSIPNQIAHTAVWFWEKFGGDERGFDRDIANLTFSEYNVGETKVANELQRVYLQREETYSVRRKPEKAKHKLWFNVDDTLYRIAKTLKPVDLGQCVLVKDASSVCLQEKPQIKTVEKGSGSNIYVNNQGYRDFLHSQLDITSIDIESAAIAMVCETENKAFIAMTTVTNHAGGSSPGNDVSVIRNLWPDHARVVIRV
ncbi:phosphorylase family protein, partial [Acinetobacter baumannii]|uniref:phosphorylase family protein n=1 Tax=Acinetobacter baumannii TaxID=470 RepID=UPI002244FB03